MVRQFSLQSSLHRFINGRLHRICLGEQVSVPHVPKIPHCSKIILGYFIILKHIRHQPIVQLLYTLLLILVIFDLLLTVICFGSECAKIDLIKLI